MSCNKCGRTANWQAGGTSWCVDCLNIRNEVNKTNDEEKMNLLLIEVKKIYPLISGIRKLDKNIEFAFEGCFNELHWLPISNAPEKVEKFVKEWMDKGEKFNPSVSPPPEDNTLDLKPLQKMIRDDLDNHAKHLSKELANELIACRSKLSEDFHRYHDDLFEISHKIEDMMEAFDPTALSVAEESKYYVIGSWKDFNPDESSHLVDDDSYLVRWKVYDGSWSTPELVYWCQQEKRFIIYRSMQNCYLKIDQYLHVPK